MYSNICGCSSIYIDVTLSGVVFFGSYYYNSKCSSNLGDLQVFETYLFTHYLHLLCIFISLEISFMLYNTMPLIHLLKLYIWISGQRVNNFFDIKKVFFMSISSSKIGK